MNFVTETRPLEFRALHKSHVWPMCPVCMAGSVGQLCRRLVLVEEKSLFPSLTPPPLCSVWKTRQILR